MNFFRFHTTLRRKQVKPKSFFMAFKPPTTTHQQKAVRVVNGKPVFYEPIKLKEARRTLTGFLLMNKPGTPLKGPVELQVCWIWNGKGHRDGEWKVTKPDTDNLQKLLKDCMTACGYWQDDAQVVSETVQKRWGDVEGIYVWMRELENE